MTTPDAVCKEYARKKIKITIRALDDEESTLLIEGEREGLEFLGKLFLAQARSEDCGFQLGRWGAGKAFFSKMSTSGLYIHRLHRLPSGKNKRTKLAKKVLASLQSAK
jgi:hypothetical protein